MPYQEISSEEKTALILETVADVFENKDLWCQFSQSRDRYNMGVTGYDTTAERWCLTSAIRQATETLYPDHVYSDYDRQYPMATNYLKQKLNVIHFNDNECKRAQEVVTFLRQKVEELKKTISNKI